MNWKRSYFEKQTLTPYIIKRKQLNKAGGNKHFWYEKLWKMFSVPGHTTGSLLEY